MITFGSPCAENSTRSGNSAGSAARAASQARRTIAAAAAVKPSSA